MKQTRIVPSSSPVTTIRVMGTDHHFFHSEALGKCRAILISDDENLFYEESPKKAENSQKNTLSKGDKLAILMDCSERLHNRFMALFDALQAEKDFKKRDALLAKCQNVQKASRRVTRKIGMILEL